MGWPEASLNFAAAEPQKWPRGKIYDFCSRKNSISQKKTRKRYLPHSEGRIFLSQWAKWWLRGPWEDPHKTVAKIQGEGVEFEMAMSRDRQKFRRNGFRGLNSLYPWFQTLLAIFRSERDPQLPGGLRPDGARPLVLPGPPAAPGDPQQLGLAPRRAGSSKTTNTIQKTSVKSEYPNIL